MEQRILMCGGDEPQTRRLVGLAGDLSRSMPDAITLLVTSAETDWMELPDRLVLVEVPGAKASGARRCGSFSSTRWRPTSGPT